jgi:hypothetical protein
LQRSSATDIGGLIGDKAAFDMVDDDGPCSSTNLVFSFEDSASTSPTMSKLHLRYFAPPGESHNHPEFPCHHRGARASISSRARVQMNLVRA